MRNCHFKVDISRSVFFKFMHAAGCCINIYATPALFIEQVSIGVAEGVMGSDIDKESFSALTEHALQYHVLAFLGITAACETLLWFLN